MNQPSPNDFLNALMDTPPEDPRMRANMGNLFLMVKVRLPCLSDPTGPDGHRPLVVDRDGVPHMIVLTSDAALHKMGEHATWALETTGESLVETMLPGVGLHLDNGTSSLTFPPETVERLQARIAELRSRDPRPGDGA